MWRTRGLALRGRVLSRAAEEWLVWPPPVRPVSRRAVQPAARLRAQVQRAGRPQERGPEVGVQSDSTSGAWHRGPWRWRQEWQRQAVARLREAEEQEQ
jgi:hypothetical protein